MTSRSRELAARAASAATAAALLGTLLVGCSDDEPAGAGGPTPSSSETGSESPDPSDSASPGDTDPAVEPASGPVVRSPGGSLRVPEGWVTTGSQLFTDAEREPKRPGDIEREVHGFIDVTEDDRPDEMSLDEAAREAGRAEDAQRVEDAELAGVPVFVLTKSTAFGDTSYLTGAWRDGRLVVIEFSLLGAEKADRLETIESVLASWEWA